MQLLRHQTKNALQRIMAQIAKTDLRATPQGNVLADDIERRICLSARISDALFGLTEEPGPLPARLRHLCEATLALAADTTQCINLRVTVTGPCPAPLHATVLQAAHEMVSNAVQHGLRLRLTGQVMVTLTSGRNLMLEVRDDGWGLAPVGRSVVSPARMPFLQLLADQHGGLVSLERQEGWTIARFQLPQASSGPYRLGQA